jgi:hypothetical protein
VTSRVSLYGLVIETDRSLPGLSPLTSASPAADIRVMGAPASDFSEARAAAGKPNSWFSWDRLDGGEDYLRWTDLFEFLISADGSVIRGIALRDIDPETYAVYLLNQALSFALIKRGAEPVHSTVVQIGEGAVAICGEPGAGKTSMAAALLARGHRMVTDDLLLVRWGDAGPLAQRGAPRIKLMPDTAERYLGSLAKGVAMNPDTNKRIVSLPPELVSDEQVPVRLIAFPRKPREGKVVIRRLPQRRAFLDLVANTFNPIVETTERLEVKFDEDIALAGRVPCVSVGLPRTWQALENAVDRIETLTRG